MKTILKIVGEVILGFGFLYGMVQGHIIDSQTAITIGILVFVFILSFEELKKEFSPIKNALCEMQLYLGSKWKFIPMHEIKPTGYVQSFSPMALTTLGADLLNQSGAKQAVDDNYIEWSRLIDAQKPKTALDIQTYASKIIAEKEHTLTMSPVKDFVYKNPNFNNTPLALADVQRVMVVYLRDLYIKDNQKFKI